MNKNYIKAKNRKEADAIIEKNGYYKMYLRVSGGYLVFKDKESFDLYYNINKRLG